MSEVLLQTIVEKLEALGVALLKKESTEDVVRREALVKEIKLFQSEIKMFRENFTLTNDKMSELTRSIQLYANLLQQPLKNNVEHKHHLHKGLWMTAILFNTSILLAFAWNNALQTQKQFEANDIKYRSLKVRGNESLLKLLHYTDSLFIVNGENLRKTTLQEEERLAKQAEMLRLAGQKEKEAKELKRKASERK